MLDQLTDFLADVAARINRFLVLVFGSRNERLLKEMSKLLEKISQVEPRFEDMSDRELKEATDSFRERLKKGETLDDLLPEAFAAVREAGKRAVMMRHFDVQMIGGITLHQGKIAEMVTGEGKTLVATLPAYLNALSGRGVHIVTVNDYLARRDRMWMGTIHEALGLSVGVIQAHMSSAERIRNYSCDITYGQNNEFGFDYLRDNMKISVEDQSQRNTHNFAIVDEVDSILIDEARTPLIISGPAEESTSKYVEADRVVRRLHREIDFEIKEKENMAVLTDSGMEKAEEWLGLESIYTGRNLEWEHHLRQALRAHHLYKRDHHYVVKDGEIIIVDEFTGRLMPGRRWSDGLHQAIEAKEQLRIQEENQTLATITFQNYFKLYEKISGMTGTAMTEATEFDKIYKLDVVQIPTNRRLIRTNFQDRIYANAREKWDAVADEIEKVHVTGRPILVGTVSIENSEMLSAKLKQRGIDHQVLNAKQHENEAEIVATAGRLGRVTIATNMAGRGTDIILGQCPLPELAEFWKSKGLLPRSFRTDKAPEEIRKSVLRHFSAVYLPDGAPEGASEAEIENLLLEQWKASGAEPLRLGRTVAELGGLHIIGSERHEARRIDNQLRGRSGRQGDPGSSRFFLSLEDDVMRIFAQEWVRNYLQKYWTTDVPEITNNLVARAIEKAQKRVEAHNFEIRKNLLEYDEVMNEQRRVIYEIRQDVIEGGSQKERILSFMEGQIGRRAFEALDHEAAREENSAFALSSALRRRLGILIEAHKISGLDAQAAGARILDALGHGHEALVKVAIDAFEAVRDPRVDSLSKWFEEEFGEPVPKEEFRALKPEEAAERLFALAHDGIGDYIRKAVDDNLVASEERGISGLAAWYRERFGLKLADADFRAPSGDEEEPLLPADEIADKLVSKAAGREDGLKNFILAAARARLDARAARDEVDAPGLLLWMARTFGWFPEKAELKGLSALGVTERLLSKAPDREAALRAMIYEAAVDRLDPGLNSLIEWFRSEYRIPVSKFDLRNAAHDSRAVAEILVGRVKERLQDLDVLIFDAARQRLESGKRKPKGKDDGKKEPLPDAAAFASWLSDAFGVSLSKKDTEDRRPGAIASRVLARIESPGQALENLVKSTLEGGLAGGPAEPAASPETLADWLSFNFGVDVSPSEIGGRSPGEAVSLLLSRISDPARVLEDFLESSALDRLDPRLARGSIDAQGLVDWFRDNFGVAVGKPEIRSLSPEEAAGLLLGKIRQKDEALKAVMLDGAAERFEPALEGLASWCQAALGAACDKAELRDLTPAGILEKLLSKTGNKGEALRSALAVEIAGKKDPAQLSKWLQETVGADVDEALLSSLCPAELAEKAASLSGAKFKALRAVISSAVSDRAGDSMIDWLDWLDERFGIEVQLAELGDIQAFAAAADRILQNVKHRDDALLAFILRDAEDFLYTGLKNLADWFSASFGAPISKDELRRLSPREAARKMTSKLGDLKAALESFALKKASEFLEPRGFAVSFWIEDNLETRVSAAEAAGLSPAELAKTVRSRTADPVESLRGAVTAAVEDWLSPGFGELLAWFEGKFGHRVKRSEIRDMPYSDAAERLMSRVKERYDAFRVKFFGAARSFLSAGGEPDAEGLRSWFKGLFGVPAPVLEGKKLDEAAEALLERALDPDNVLRRLIIFEARGAAEKAGGFQKAAAAMRDGFKAIFGAEPGGLEAAGEDAVAEALLESLPDRREALKKALLQGAAGLAGAPARAVSAWFEERAGFPVDETDVRDLSPDGVAEALFARAHDRFASLKAFAYEAVEEKLNRGIKQLSDWYSSRLMMRISRPVLRELTIERAKATFAGAEQEARARVRAEMEALAGAGAASSEEWDPARFGPPPAATALRGLSREAAADLLADKVLSNKLHEVLADFAEEHLNPRIAEFLKWYNDRFGLRVTRDDLRGLSPDEAADDLCERVEKAYDALEAREGPRYVRSLERYILMEIIDSKWKDHLYAMDHLKEGIGLRGYAQIDPKIEYKKEGYRMFGEMMDLISSDVTDHFFRARLTKEAEEALGSRWKASDYIHEDYSGTRAQMDQASGRDMSGEKPKPIRRETKKVGRNEPCPCGSGKKYKKCCGQ